MLAHGVRVNFDSEGQMISLEHSRSGRVSFSWNDGKLTGGTSSDGRTISVAYETGQPVAVVQGDSNVVTYNWRGRQLEAVNRSGETHRLSYDAKGFLAGIQEENGETKLDREPTGRLLEALLGVDRVRVVCPVGRLAISIQTNDAPACEWHFHPTGRIAGVTFQDHAALWTRSSDGRIIQMALGAIKTFDGGYEFEPDIVIGTLPCDK